MSNTYVMKISRLTVDKLGVKLYDRASAVIAELISNSYDADATEVTVEAPMGQYLARRNPDKTTTDIGHRIEVSDNGVGMTPDEMQKFFLYVGRERRTDPLRGDVSKVYKRRVMGRKGVGKLAPFGICKTIEVISSGGERLVEAGVEGYRTSHIILNYDAIVGDDDADYKPDIGAQDDTIQPTSGTTVILRDFAYRKVPDIETLARQVGQRFGLPNAKWAIHLKDNTKTDGDPEREKQVDSFSVETMPGTRIEFVGATDQVLSRDDDDGQKVVGPNGEIVDLSAGFWHEERFYPLRGWVAYSRKPYKDELMVGVRIYCRGKIAAQTTVFNRTAGFTGEHSIRSYLVGELHADWLDEREDLIQTDRRDILWSDEVAQAFQAWGQKVVARIGNLARDPMRTVTWERFREVGRLEARIKETYPSPEQAHIRENAREVAKTLGRALRGDETEDPEVVDDLIDLSLMLAPHITLDEMLRDAAKENVTALAAVTGLLRTARLAELASFGRIAGGRIGVIETLMKLKDNPDAPEDELQKLVEEAPWLIDPQWAPLAANQRFTTLRREFEKYYEKMTGNSINLTDFSKGAKRPDFVLSNQDGLIQIIEIKKPDHKIKNAEMDRIITYVENMEAFLNDGGNEEFKKAFGDFHVTLVSDGVDLSGAQRAAFKGYKDSGRLTHINWTAFLARTELAHKEFIQEADRQRRLVYPSNQKLLAHADE